MDFLLPLSAETSFKYFTLMYLYYYYQIPLWKLFVAFIFLFMLASWLGMYLKKIAKNRTLHEIVPSSALSVLALIAGFTFSMALSRYERRNEPSVRTSLAI
ncbi:MAG: hypothetical protein ACXVCR_18820 [Bdellovibrio sp.]